MTKPTFFETAADFRAWLRQHHRTATELWVGYRKKATGKASITRAESVDEALSFGWIDGLGKSLDTESYMVRFTPRRKGSIWSAVNTRRARELIKAGRMRAAGLAAFEARDENKTAVYSFDRTQPLVLAPALEAQFRRNRAAWTFFQAQPPGYRKVCVHMIMNAKQEATRQRRLDIVVANSAAGRRIDFMRPMRRPEEQ